MATAKKVTFQDVVNMFAETDKRFKESQRESDKRFKETGKQIKENQTSGLKKQVNSYDN